MDDAAELSSSGAASGTHGELERELEPHSRTPAPPGRDLMATALAGELQIAHIAMSANAGRSGAASDLVTERGAKQRAMASKHHLNKLNSASFVTTATAARRPTLTSHERQSLRETLDGLDDDVKERLNNWNCRKFLFFRRRTIENGMIFFALLSLAFVIVEGDYPSAATNPELQRPKASRAVEDALSCGVTASTVGLVVMLWMRYQLDVQVGRMTNRLPGFATLWNTAHLRQWFILEAVVLGFHCPPFLRGTFDVYDEALGPLCSAGICTYQYRYAIVNMFAFARLYVLMALVRNYSGMYDQAFVVYCNQNHVDPNSLSFNLRVVFTDHPMKLLVPFVAIVTVAMMFTLHMAERELDTEYVEEAVAAAAATSSAPAGY